MARKRIACGILVLIVLIGSIIYLRISEARELNQSNSIHAEENTIILTPTTVPSQSRTVTPGVNH